MRDDVIRCTITLMLVGAGVLRGQTIEPQASEPLPPNVVLVMADDLRADVMSVYGGPVPTPNLERLAQLGVRFDRATCGYPICHVSRTEIMTGRSMVAEATSGKTIPFSSDWHVLPQVFREAGWRTVHNGKWHVKATPSELGFDATRAHYSGGGSGGRNLTLPISSTGRFVTGYRGWTFKDPQNRPLLELGIGLTPETDSLIVAGAVDAIKAYCSGNKDLSSGADSVGKPLFLMVNLTAPHDPLHTPRATTQRQDATAITLPPNYLPQHPFDHGNRGGRDESIVPPPRSAAAVKFQRATYYEIVHHIDRLMGQILDALEERESLENTILIFTSDQGLSVGSHGLMGKQNQYEHTAAVPLILAGPGIPASLETSVQCCLRDLFPTLCELSDLAIPKSVESKSLVPAWGTQREIHEAIYGYFTDSQRMIRSSDGWKLIWYPRIKRTQLFYLPQDPHELLDLSKSSRYAQKHNQLLTQLREWLQSKHDPVLAP